MALDDPEAAARHRDLALPLFAAAGDLLAQGTVLHDLGADARRLGQLEVALWMYERSQDARTRAGDIVRAAASGNAVGEVLLELGRVEEAADRFGDALRAWRGARSTPGVALALCNLGAAALSSDDAPRAVRRLEEAQRCADDVGDDRLLARIRVLLGEALLEVGRLVEAWEAASLALAAGDDLGRSGRSRAHECRAGTLERTGGTERAALERAAGRAAANAEPGPSSPAAPGTTVA
jgi:tetratricopeptide (TPR) repeat protein